MTHSSIPVTQHSSTSLLSIPPSIDILSLWLASLRSAQTRRAYLGDVREFMAFMKITQFQDFGAIKRAHVIAWRAMLESRRLTAATVCRKLAALSAVYEFCIETGDLSTNPLRGLRRPRADKSEGKTPRLSSEQAHLLLNSPSAATAKGMRDRAILSLLLYAGLRRQELCNLKLGSYALQREGAPHLRVIGKGNKVRFVPLHDHTLLAVQEYLKLTPNLNNPERALFLRVDSSGRFIGGTGISADGVYKSVFRPYLKQIGIAEPGFGVHCLRVTAATSALENGADLNLVRRWLGHSHISTTVLYDRRSQRLVDSPSFLVRYD